MNGEERYSSAQPNTCEPYSEMHETEQWQKADIYVKA